MQPGGGDGQESMVPPRAHSQAVHQYRAKVPLTVESLPFYFLVPVVAHPQELQTEEHLKVYMLIYIL